MAFNDRGLRRFMRSKVFWPVCIMFAMMVIGQIFMPDFFKISILDGHLRGVLVDILNRSTQIMVIAVGLTLVIATGGIDISVGAVMAISGSLCAALIGGNLVLVGDQQEFVTNFPMWFALIVALGVAAIAGAWNGLLVTKLGMQPIVATLVLLIAGRGIAQLISGGQITTIYYQPYFFIGNGFLVLPFTIYIVAVIAAAAMLFTRKTALGLFIESIGINPTASRYSGVRSDRIKIGLYAFCAFCAGVAGILYSSNVKSADANNMGDMMELDAILAVVIGGTSMSGGRFSIAGSIIGALVVQTLTTTILAIGMPAQVTALIKALVVVIICLIQSQRFRDLLGARRRVAA